jgi:hypothetical protein
MTTRATFAVSDAQRDVWVRFVVQCTAAGENPSEIVLALVEAYLVPDTCPHVSCRYEMSTDQVRCAECGETV